MYSCQKPASHTGEHVGNVLHKAKLEWGCKVNALTTDNAANRASETNRAPIQNREKIVTVKVEGESRPFPMAAEVYDSILSKLAEGGG